MAFVSARSEPGALAGKATKGLVRLAFQLISSWPQSWIETLSQSFGNFDRVVALGWLLGDVAHLREELSQARELIEKLRGTPSAVWCRGCRNDQNLNFECLG